MYRMDNRFRAFPIFLLCVIVIAACTATAGTNGTQPVSADQISTAVALTLQATVSEVNGTPVDLPD